MDSKEQTEAATGPDDAATGDIGEARSVLERAVARYCPSWLRSRQDDIVQAAAMKVLSLQKKGEGHGPRTASYLWRVAHSATVDEIRRWRSRQEAPGPAEAPEAVSTRTPADDLSDREVGLAIRDCLRGLAADRRVAVTLQLQGHGVPDIARLLGWSRKRAENQVYRGLADLRACLIGKGVRDD